MATPLSLRYRKSALEDLQDIALYYGNISEETHDRVYRDIVSTLEAVRVFPNMYARYGSGRRAVTSTYGFNIIYCVYPDMIDIVGIYRQLDRP